VLRNLLQLISDVLTVVTTQ